MEIHGERNLSTYEYVASAVSYLKIFNIPLLNNLEVLKEVKDIFRSINTENHKFSFLYNAYDEDKYGQYINQYYRDDLYNVHADSGGLQVITRGLIIDDNLKNKVYESQGKYSDIAMSFDEIPLITNGISVIGDTSARRFDMENLKNYIKLSSKNLVEQIEYFDKMGVRTKPMMIVHGNCYDSFMKWFDLSLKMIPSDYHDKIAGIALSGASHGSGLKEEIERSFVMGQMTDFKKYFHLLGVGSVRRLLPYIVFNNNGYYPKDVHLSYDSTTHTKSVTTGTYRDNNYNLIKLKTHYNNNYKNLYHDLENIGIHLSCEYKDHYQIMNSDSSYFMDKRTGVVNNLKMKDYYLAKIGIFKLSVMRFMKTVDSLKSRSTIEAFAHKIKSYKEIKTLYDVNDLSSFENWKQQNASIKNRGVKVNLTQNLEEFF